MKQIEGKYSPSKSRIQSLFCLQVQNTHSFCRQQNGRIFTIFHQVDGKSDFVIHLLERQKCHIQYVSKVETDFKGETITVKIYMYIYNTNAIPLSCHFAMKDHISNRNASFIITQQICKSNLSRVTKKKLLKQRE